MVENYTSNLEVMLGYLEPPLNSLITTARFLPSKVGGIPVFSFILFFSIGRN